MLQPWIDVETTGLDEHNDLLLEVGIVVTDGLLGDCAEVFDFKIGVQYPDDAVDAVLASNDYVRGMHTKSRLLEWLRMPENVVPPQDLDALLCAIGEAWAPDGCADKPPLANFNAPFDRRWLSVWAPKFVATRLHYRCFDLSTLRATVEAVYPHGFGPASTANVHRAVPDARAAVLYWKWYRQHVMNPYGRHDVSEAQ
jgi:oligoribonuclease